MSGLAFNPNVPADHSPLSSAEMRGQFNSLKALIDELPTYGAMQDAILEQTAGSALSIGLLVQPISNPPTQAEVLAIMGKLNDLIDTLNRA